MLFRSVRNVLTGLSEQECASVELDPHLWITPVLGQHDHAGEVSPLEVARLDSLAIVVFSTLGGVVE